MRSLLQPTGGRALPCVPRRPRDGGRCSGARTTHGSHGTRKGVHAPPRIQPPPPRSTPRAGARIAARWLHALRGHVPAPAWPRRYGRKQATAQRDMQRLNMAQHPLGAACGRCRHVVAQIVDTMSRAAAAPLRQFRTPVHMFTRVWSVRLPPPPCTPWARTRTRPEPWRSKARHLLLASPGVTPCHSAL